MEMLFHEYSCISVVISAKCLEFCFPWKPQNVDPFRIIAEASHELVLSCKVWSYVL